MFNSTKNYIVVIILMVTIFSIYNFVVYTSNSYSVSEPLSPQAIEGQEIWHKESCWACHQIYGLGGYLGPDLTNIISNPNKGPAFIKAFMNTGVNTMPKFNFTDSELDAIIEYLTSIDKTGYFPNYDAQIDPSGWVKIKYKDEK